MVLLRIKHDPPIRCNSCSGRMFLPAAAQERSPSHSLRAPPVLEHDMCFTVREYVTNARCTHIAQPGCDRILISPLPFLQCVCTYVLGSYLCNRPSYELSFTVDPGAPTERIFTFPGARFLARIGGEA